MGVHVGFVLQLWNHELYHLFLFEMVVDCHDYLRRQNLRPVRLIQNEWTPVRNLTSLRT